MDAKVQKAAELTEKVKADGEAIRDLKKGGTSDLTKAKRTSSRRQWEHVIVAALKWAEQIVTCLRKMRVSSAQGDRAMQSCCSQVANVGSWA